MKMYETVEEMMTLYIFSIVKNIPFKTITFHTPNDIYKYEYKLFL